MVVVQRHNECDRETVCNGVVPPRSVKSLTIMGDAAIAPLAALPGRGRGRGAPTPDVRVIQTGRAGAPSAAGRADSALSIASSVAPPSPTGSRAASVAGSALSDLDKKAADKAVRAQEKELRKEPLPLGWKVYGAHPAVYTVWACCPFENMSST